MSFFRFILIINFFTLGCVSIDIPKRELSRSTSYNYKKPDTKLFNHVESDELDKLWTHKKSGNSISLLSDCSTSYDPSLKQIKNGITSGIYNLKNKSNIYKTYNNRKALFSHLTGDVDGVTSEFELVIFKKNGCVYTITHVGTKASYKQTKEFFDKFILNFKVD